MARKQNKVKFGIKNAYYSKITFDDDTGAATFATPKRLKGAVSLSMEPQGENEPFYADDSIYVLLSSSSNYEGDLELALIPEDFYTDILHEELDSNGVMAEVEDPELEHFALLFEISGDQHKVRHVFYNCVCSRPTVETSTVEDTKEPQTDTLSLTAMPLINGYVKAKTTSTTSDDVYDSWFDQVYEPQSEAEEETDTEEADG